MIEPMMNGSDEEVMKALDNVTKNLGKESGSFLPHGTRDYVTELWARNITKEQFLEWQKQKTI